jgi:tRNA A-37 threonylcarbamoyl transferase component Bud32
MSGINSNAVSRYFGVDGSLDDIRENCQTAFHPRKHGATIFKQGAYGSISEVCQRSNCKFVAKVVPIASPEQKKAFVREARISKPLGDAGLAPKVHDIFTCLNAGFIVMETWEGSFRGLLEKEKYPRKLDLEQIGVLIQKMHRLGVIHNDLHVGNILYTHKKGKRLFSITDFGLASQFTSPQEVLSDNKVPTARASNIFFPAFDYYKLSNSIEVRTGMIFESFFLEKNFLTYLEYILVDKFWYYEPRVGQPVKVNFLDFLQKQRIARDMTRTLPSNPENAYLPLSTSGKKKRRMRGKTSSRQRSLSKSKRSKTKKTTKKTTKSTKTKQKTRRSKSKSSLSKISKSKTKSS